MGGDDGTALPRRRGRLIVAAALGFAALALAISFAPNLARLTHAFGVSTGGYPVRVEFGPSRAAPLAAAAPAAPALPDTQLPDADPPTGAAATVEAIPAPSAAALSAPNSMSARERAGILALDFDISPDAAVAGSPGGGSRVDIAKPITLNGIEAGSIAIRVGRDSLIYLDRAGLAKALQSVDSQVGARIADDAGKPYLSLDELRARGISVRYDAVADRIRLES